MLYYALRPSVENLSVFIATLEAIFYANAESECGKENKCEQNECLASEWIVSAFELLSNIIEHNFYGRKFSHLSIFQLKRESKKHYRHKILIAIRTKNANAQSHAFKSTTKGRLKTFAMRCIVAPKFTPVFPSKISTRFSQMLARKIYTKNRNEKQGKKEYEKQDKAQKQFKKTSKRESRFSKSHIQNLATSKITHSHKLKFLQNGRGMRIIYRFCTLRLAKITPTKYRITLRS